jgi:hypothetical protein
MRVASPRQGDFAEPDREFKGEDPALAHLSHRCDMFANGAVEVGFPNLLRF